MSTPEGGNSSERLTYDAVAQAKKDSTFAFRGPKYADEGERKWP